MLGRVTGSSLETAFTDCLKKNIDVFVDVITLAAPAVFSANSPLLLISDNKVAYQCC